MTTVAALFTRQDSVYKALSGVEAYDMERDARTYDGPWPVVAHPPCRAWGGLRHFAKPRPDERNLARLAVALVREFGGVLEHPAHSSLWRAQQLPPPASSVPRDGYGGWTLPITQQAWGHRAEKATWLYIVGCDPVNLPSMPVVLGDSSHVIASSRNLRAGMPGYRPQLPKPEREHTPPLLAEWLVELARRCGS